MTDYLVQYGDTVLSKHPGADRQYIIAPARISPSWGLKTNLNFLRYNFNLPNNADIFHVFVFGALSPYNVGMIPTVNQWVSAKAHANATSLLIDIYTTEGLHIPLHRSYFLRTTDNNLFLAVASLNTMPTVKTSKVFVRWRSSLWFDKTGAVPYDQGIITDGLTVSDVTSFYNFQLKWVNDKALNPNGALAYVNGYHVSDISQGNSKVGDTVEYIVDRSVKEVISIPLSTLPTFISTLDGVDKRLFYRDGYGDTVDYLDDVDFFLLNESQGIYYHKNGVDAVRQVTHRDYALKETFISSLLGTDPAWIDRSKITVKCLVRYSDFENGVPYGENRLNELFKLPLDKRLKAMVGEEAGVDQWTASKLESSAYSKIMGMSLNDITRSIVTEAMGYHAIASLVSDTPVRVAISTGTRWIRLPISCIDSVTVYEYDDEGMLLGYYSQLGSFDYLVRNQGTVCCEIYGGVATTADYTDYSGDGFTIVDGVEYRFYMASMIGGVVQNDWKDVTGDTTKYVVTGNVVTWLVDLALYKVAVRKSNHFFTKDFLLSYRDRALVFSVLSNVDSDLLVSPIEGLVELPFGEVDVFLNGRILVENVDYFINWPEIGIVNKEYLHQDTVMQTVTVRGRGFVRKDMSRYMPKDVGWTIDHSLSVDTSFNLRDEMVSRISVDGQIYLKDELTWGEGSIGSIIVPNGKPYQVMIPYIDLSQFIDTDTIDLRTQDEALDTKIEDYLSVVIPQIPPTTPNPVSGWYKVFSPFCTKLIYDMLDGVLNMNEFTAEYTLDWLKDRLKGYTWLLDYDPCVIGYNTDYVEVHPHPESDVISLTIYQYRLLQRAITVFLQDKITLNRSLVIVEEGFEHYQVDHPHPYRTWDQVE